MLKRPYVQKKIVLFHATVDTFEKVTWVRWLGEKNNKK